MRKNILLIQEDDQDHNHGQGLGHQNQGQGKGQGQGRSGGSGGGGSGSMEAVNSLNYHCPEKAEALLQKLMKQVKADNTEKKLNMGCEDGLEGNVIDVPLRVDEISCPWGVPLALWEMMKRYIA